VYDEAGDLILEDASSGIDLSTIEEASEENLEIEVHLVSNSTSGNIPSMSRLKVNFKPALLGDQGSGFQEVATW
jgi:hypothetical protein